MPTITVIVPVYKVEDYICECIDSILQQSFSDYELLLIDDGSPDNCGQICDQYAKKDSRINVIHQDNMGLSGARNTGIERAIGKYITFIDSDDFIPECYLEVLYNAITSEGADISVVPMKVIEDDDEPIITKINISKEYECNICDGRNACIKIYEGNASVPINACGKLFSREIIGLNRFPIGRLHEDQAFVPIVCYHSKKLVSISEALYCYRHREFSITKSKFSIKRYDDLWALDQCISFFAEMKETKILEAAYQKRKRLLSVYTIYAKRDGVKVPDEYRMNIFTALIYLRRVVSTDSFQYYLAQVYPDLVIIDAYIRRIGRLWKTN